MIPPLEAKVKVGIPVLFIGNTWKAGFANEWLNESRAWW
jgi:hypothetical protein